MLRLWRTSLVLLALGALACDDEKQPAPTKPSATATAVAAAPFASAAPVAKKPARKLKTKGDCGAKLSFDDAQVEAAVRLKLQKPQGEISYAELGKLTSLNLSQTETHQLDPCIFPHTKNLKELFLGPGDVSDLSMLADLTKLETLRASINKVEDLKPLAKLTKLDRLDLGRTQVRDVAPLAGLTQLTELALDDTPVSDVSPLGKLENLERLSLQRTRVKDVSALKGLKKLKFLYIQDTPVEDTSALAPLRANGLKIVEI
ncbi:MAG: leucine-rich repeat domain-containing protein [Polyangiaceae bacterium]